MIDFNLNQSMTHFKKIFNDTDHPLYPRMVFNTSRDPPNFRPLKAKIEKRANSFFIFPIMNYFSQRTEPF